MGGAGSKTEVKVLTPRQVGVVASPPLTTPRSGRRRGVGTRAEHQVARLERMRKPQVRLAMSVTTVVGLQRLKRKAQANIAEKRRREKMSRGDRKVAQLERKKTASSRLDDVVTPRRSG